MLSDVGSTPTISTIDIKKQALCLFFYGLLSVRLVGVEANVGTAVGEQVR